MSLPHRRWLWGAWASSYQCNRWVDEESLQLDKASQYADTGKHLGRLGCRITVNATVAVGQSYPTHWKHWGPGVWATRIVQQWRLDVYSILFASFCSWVVKGLLNMFHDSFCSFDFYILRRHQSAGRWQLQEYGHLHSCSCTCSLAGFLCEVACQFAFWNFYAILDDRHQEGHKCEWAAAAAYDTGIVRWHGCSYCRW